jgi:hypothetical protein
MAKKRGSAGAGAPGEGARPGFVAPRATDRVPDQAPDIPGRQLSDPDAVAEAAWKGHPIQPQRRGPGSR